MAVARQEQRNVMLYTVITFVGLFIVAAVLAVLFYIKSEDWRNQFLTSQQNQEEFATSSEVQNVGTLIGQKERKASRTRQLLGYINKIYKMDTGTEPGETSAEAKLVELDTKYKDIVASLERGFVPPPAAAETNSPAAVTDVNAPAQAVVTDANKPATVAATNTNAPATAAAVTDVNSAPSLFRIVEIYNNKLRQMNETAGQLNTQIANLNSELETSKTGAAERESSLLAQVRSVQQDANSVQQSYNQLRDLMDKKSNEQVQSLTQQRDQSVEEKNKSKQELLDAMNKLSVTQNRLQETLSKLEVSKSKPKEDVAAYKPDGHIISIDISSKVAFIDIGIQDKVYPGLTFSVYNKSAPIPTDGNSGNEIEVLNVDKNTSMARINKMSKKNPISEGDIIVNLIWDSKATNRFVVAGDFDFNGDGEIDSDGAAKIEQLIQNWGGKVEDTVTTNTDFVILGDQPQVKKKPTLDETEADPMAAEKYDASVKASEKYLEVKNQAKDLYIPIFGLKRFLNFIGYESLASGLTSQPQTQTKAKTQTPAQTQTKPAAQPKPQTPAPAPAKTKAK
ncbi:MAG: hypothetical protein ABR969_02370 [Sedimentisphaerales bacterium]|jgi:hypothetical protein